MGFGQDQVRTALAAAGGDHRIGTRLLLGDDPDYVFDETGSDQIRPLQPEPRIASRPSRRPPQHPWRPMPPQAKQQVTAKSKENIEEVQEREAMTAAEEAAFDGDDLSVDEDDGEDEGQDHEGEDEVEALKQQYCHVFGKRPRGPQASQADWLRAKIMEAQEPGKPRRRRRRRQRQGRGETQRPRVVAAAAAAAAVDRAKSQSEDGFGMFDQRFKQSRKQGRKIKMRRKMTSPGCVTVIPWSADQQRALETAVTQFGTNFSLVSEMISEPQLSIGPRRSPQECTDWWQKQHLPLSTRCGGGDVAGIAAEATELLAGLAQVKIEELVQATGDSDTCNNIRFNLLATARQNAPQNLRHHTTMRFERPHPSHLAVCERLPNVNGKHFLETIPPTPDQVPVRAHSSRPLGKEPVRRLLWAPTNWAYLSG
eukprot:SAG22_NODE_1494_length_4300_cov_6.567722_4_plen_425_part_00